MVQDYNVLKVSCSYIMIKSIESNTKLLYDKHKEESIVLEHNAFMSKAFASRFKFNLKFIKLQTNPVTSRICLLMLNYFKRMFKAAKTIPNIATTRDKTPIIVIIT